MFRLPATLLTFAFALSAANAGTVCKVPSSGGDKGTYPITTLTPGDGSSGGSETTYTSTSTSSGSHSTGTGAPPVSTGISFNYGVDKIRGTNAGGWLLLEPWITPSLFDATGNDDIIDEYTFGELQDKTIAEAALKVHWETWFVEQDFHDIAAAGLNHIRIPIGYWAFDVTEDEPYIQGQLPYLQKALGWAENAGLKVIIDLHGVPGSQNGFDNSGQKLDKPTWHTKRSNVERTEEILEQIAGMFAPNSSVAPIISPVNEPAGFYGEEVLDVVRDYYTTSYNIIRHPNGQGPDSNIIVLIHDAFMNGSYWGDFLTSGHEVVMDTHQYQVFTFDVLNQTLEQHITTACNVSNLIDQYELPVVVGEWSAAVTDCALYLNGRGEGVRWDGTFTDSPFENSCEGYSGSALTFTEEYKTFLRKYWEAQAIAYETSYGWIQWTWKTEPGTADEWSYKTGIEYGWIPQDAAERQYPNICTEALAAAEQAAAEEAAEEAAIPAESTDEDEESETTVETLASPTSSVVVEAAQASTTSSSVSEAEETVYRF